MKILTAEDAETKSPDVVAGNVEQLRTMFPEAFTEGKVDFEVLKQLLGGAVEEREGQGSLRSLPPPALFGPVRKSAWTGTQPRTS
jgi:hypothetical protein